MTYSKEAQEKIIQLEQSLKEEKLRFKEEARRKREEEKERRRAQKEAERGVKPIDLINSIITNYEDKGLKLLTVLAEHTSKEKPIYAYNPRTGDITNATLEITQVAIDEWSNLESSSTFLSNMKAFFKCLLNHQDVLRVPTLQDPDHCILANNGQVVVFNEHASEAESYISSVPLEIYAEEHPGVIFKSKANFAFNNDTYKNLIQTVDSLNAYNELERFLPSIYRDFWEAHLDTDNLQALLECLGNLIIPITSGRMRLFSLWQGARRTGKSATGELVKQLLPGLVGTVNFCRGQFDSWDYTRCRRLVQQELPDNSKIDSSKMKADSSGDTRDLDFKNIRAGLYKTFGSYACVLAANSTPQIGDQLTNAISDRLQYVNFKHTYKGDNSHNVLLDGSEEDREKLACVCLLSLELAYHRGNFTRPRYELAGISEDSSDVLKRWAGAVMSPGGNDWVYYEDLAGSFYEWCEYNLEDYKNLVTPPGTDMRGMKYPARWTRGNRGEGQSSVRALMKQLQVSSKRTSKSWAFNVTLDDSFKQDTEE